ncbi:hypothetical protein [Polaromonas sp.]|uniref:hypothetical protein n=1 Tax=Polaromonas sp. TaxID=1869339 RepID=UPI0018280CA8|nr:hypothetical protein [Polaromonas sp.]NMM05637.1 hypothetical protein [Polaromonas sp.]
MAKIIEFRIAQLMQSTAAVKKCCERCGSDVWHIRQNGEIYCADCEEVCSLQLQVKNEH